MQIRTCLTMGSFLAAEMDILVPLFMGVSPAILENVIFCHQEESNWSTLLPEILFTVYDSNVCQGSWGTEGAQRKI
jgi:hypothetical protein